MQRVPLYERAAAIMRVTRAPQAMLRRERLPLVQRKGDVECRCHAAPVRPPPRDAA